MPRIQIFLIVFFYSFITHAWGLRGHDTICQAATFLVQDAKLQSYLKPRGPQMGHLCNIPDIYWRSNEAGKEAKEFNGPTHYIDVEILGLPIEKIPLDYQKIITDFQGKPSAFEKEKTIKNIPEELGSVWWRADQLVRLATNYGKQAVASLSSQEKSETAEAPAKKSAEKSEMKTEKAEKKTEKSNPEFNTAIFQMTNSMGLLGHFVGDTSMPYHSSADHDGYGVGHGGIHTFYETLVVGEIDSKLLNDVVTRAQSLRKTWKPKGNVLERMRELSKASHPEIKKIEALDKTKTASLYSHENGIQIKKPAERELNSKAVAAYRSMIVEQMARSALLLSDFWQEIYKSAGEPNFQAYKSYDYPLKPDFVMPDYFKIETPKATK